MKRWSCLLVNMQGAGSSRLPAMAEQRKLLVPALPEKAFTTKQVKPIKRGKDKLPLPAVVVRQRGGRGWLTAKQTGG